jgi:predicted esterase
VRLIALHGHGDEPDAFGARIQPWFSPLAAEIVTPPGPIALDTGRAWFNDGSPGELTALVAALDDTLEGPDDVIVGWSQGTAAALAYAMHEPTRPVHALAGIAGWFPTLDGHHLAATPGLSLLLVHGDDDEVVDPMLGRSAARLAERNGADVRWSTIDAGHELDAAIPTVLSWLAARERPTTPR